MCLHTDTRLLEKSNQLARTVDSVCSHFGVALWGYKCIRSLQTVLLSLCVFVIACPIPVWTF